MTRRLIEGTTADALADTARSNAAIALASAVIAWVAFAMMESGWRYVVGGIFVLTTLGSIAQAVSALNKGTLAGMLEVRPWADFATFFVIAGAAVAIYIVDGMLFRLGLGFLALTVMCLIGALFCYPKQE